MVGVTCPGPSRLPWNGCAASCFIGPWPVPAGGSRKPPMLIQPRSLPENCGILSLAEVWLAEICADDGALPASAMPMPSAAAVAQSHALRATELVLHLNPNVSMCSSPLRRFDC